MAVLLIAETQNQNDFFSGFGGRIPDSCGGVSKPRFSELLRFSPNGRSGTAVKQSRTRARTGAKRHGESNPANRVAGSRFEGTDRPL